MPKITFYFLIHMYVVCVFVISITKKCKVQQKLITWGTSFLSHVDAFKTFHEGRTKTLCIRAHKKFQSIWPKVGIFR